MVIREFAKMKIKQNKASLSHSSIHIYWTAIMCHTTGRTGSPFQNPWHAHTLFSVLALGLLHSQFPLWSLGNGSEDHADFLGKYNSISHIFFSSQHWWEFWLHFIVARARSCPSDSCPDLVRSVGQGWLFLSYGWGNWSSGLLRHLARVSAREGARLWKPLPHLFLAHLSFTPWRALKNIRLCHYPAYNLSIPHTYSYSCLSILTALA